MYLRTDRRGCVAILILARPPHNFFDAGLIGALADAVADADGDKSVRCTVLAADGRNFCAGADFGAGDRPDPAPIYAQAERLMARTKPMVAAIRGAAVGGGFGLALTADLRVGCPDSSFHANFARIGLSAGFGLSFTLPRLVGPQTARDLLLTTRRVKGEEAFALGLLDRLVPLAEVHAAATDLAADIGVSSPAALAATRALLGDGERRAFGQAVARELALQTPLFAADDFAEGVAAARERRTPLFSDLEGDRR